MTTFSLLSAAAPLTAALFVFTAQAFVSASEAGGGAAEGEALLHFGPMASRFVAVDDRVMGGVSRSTMRQHDEGHAVFEGTLSLENNGGFASVRAAGLTLDMRGATTLVLRVRGDGRRYKLRLHDDTRFDGVAHQAVFETPAGEWAEIALPIESFVPVWRGRVVTNAAPLDRGRVTMVGVMVSDAQEGRFSLELDTLSLR